LSEEDHGTIVEYLRKVGDPSDHRKGFEVALSLDGEVGELLALAHLDHLLLSKQPVPSGISKLKLKKRHDGTFATSDGDMIKRLSVIKDVEEIAKLSSKARNPQVRYCAVIGMVKGLADKPAILTKIKKALKGLVKVIPEHAGTLKSSLEAFKLCRSCRGRRVVRCEACKGRGKRVITCPQCRGEGMINWPHDMEKPMQRRLRDSALGIPMGKSYCPSCLNKDDVKQRVVDCDFCGRKGKVTCQRCKWQVIKVETIGKLQPCRNCAGSGMMFSKIAHPCRFCWGVGEFLILHKKPEATIGPLE
jgi:hypothetical protein